MRSSSASIPRRLTRYQGAAAVLDFYAIESPLAQPRNAILGQLVSALVGVATCKLFMLSPHFEAIRWLGASFACAMATAAMGLVRPPPRETLETQITDPSLNRQEQSTPPPVPPPSWPSSTPAYPPSAGSSSPP